MKTQEHPLEVSLVKYVCPVCGQVDEDASAIVMNQLLTQEAADNVKKLHNQVVGFSDKPCKQCQSYIDQDAVMIIGIDSDKSEDMSNPYRTGHLVGIKRESEFIKHLPEEYQKRDWFCMDYKEMKNIGLIQE